MKKEEMLSRITSLENEAKSLRELLGSSKNKSGKIMDRIKTFEDACEETEENPSDEKFIKGSEDTIAYEKIKVISRALNGDWKPDWNNTNQPKYYPYFDTSGSGFRFSATVYDYRYTSAGSRLCYGTSKLAEYAGKEFESTYKKFIC